MWLPAWSSASTSGFHKVIFIVLWQNGTLSFFFGPVFLFFLVVVFFNQCFPSMTNGLFISKELPHVNFVKCMMYTKYGNNMKKTSLKTSSCHKNSLWGFTQVWDYDTFWFINFYLKIHFPTYWGAFKDFRNFFMETLGWMFEFSKSNKRKFNLFSLWRWEVTLRVITMYHHVKLPWYCFKGFS